jgi:hypothetical protein
LNSFPVHVEGALSGQQVSVVALERVHVCTQFAELCYLPCAWTYHWHASSTDAPDSAWCVATGALKYSIND